MKINNCQFYRYSHCGGRFGAFCELLQKKKKMSDIETERCLNLRGEEREREREREREHHRTHVQFTHPSVDNISIHIYILCNI